MNSDYRPRIMSLRVSRAVGAVALLVTGGVHLEQFIVAHFSVIPTIGTLFLANFIASTAIGLILLVPLRPSVGPRRLVFETVAVLAGLGVMIGAIAALLISEQTPLFGFMENGYRLEIVIALIAEVVGAIALSTFLICVRARMSWFDPHQVRERRAHLVGAAPRSSQVSPDSTATGR